MTSVKSFLLEKLMRPSMTSGLPSSMNVRSAKDVPKGKKGQHYVVEGGAQRYGVPGNSQVYQYMATWEEQQSLCALLGQ